MRQTPALDHLLGAYLHQDWRSEATDVWGVVDLFVNEEPALASALPSEIAVLLEEQLSESDLKKIVVDDRGGYYLADRSGGTYAAWLQQIADRVRAATAG